MRRHGFCRAAAASALHHTQPRILPLPGGVLLCFRRVATHLSCHSVRRVQVCQLLRHLLLAALQLCLGGPQLLLQLRHRSALPCQLFLQLLHLQQSRARAPRELLIPPPWRRRDHGMLQSCPSGQLGMRLRACRGVPGGHVPLPWAPHPCQGEAWCAHYAVPLHAARAPGLPHATPSSYPAALLSGCRMGWHAGVFVGIATMECRSFPNRWLGHMLSFCVTG